jgi:hypothetical protein
MRSSVQRRTDETEEVHRRQILAIVRKDEPGRTVTDLVRDGQENPPGGLDLWKRCLSVTRQKIVSSWKS